MRLSRRWSSDDGSASLEFITVGMILLVPLVYLVLALSAVQSGALAAEGARYAALADSGLARGAERTKDLITTAVGSTYATGVAAAYAQSAGHLTVEVQVTAPLPLLGMLGFDRGLRVVGHAVVETLE